MSAAIEPNNTEIITSPCIDIYTLIYLIYISNIYKIQVWCFMYIKFDEAYGPLSGRLFEFKFHDSKINELTFKISAKTLCSLFPYSELREEIEETNDCENETSKDYELILQKKELKDVIPYLKDKGWKKETARNYDFWIAIKCTKI